MTNFLLQMLIPLKVLKSALERWGPKTKSNKNIKTPSCHKKSYTKINKKLGNSTSFGSDGIDSISLKLGGRGNYRSCKFYC